MTRLGGGRDGENEHRRTFGTFATALAASGLHFDADRRAKVLEVIDAVTELKGRPPDSDGYTVQTSGGEVRIVWEGRGEIVVHAGFIDCRHRLDGFGPPKTGGWHERSFPGRGGGAGRGDTALRSWTCGCYISQGPGVDVCETCGVERSS